MTAKFQFVLVAETFCLHDFAKVQLKDNFGILIKPSTFEPILRNYLGSGSFFINILLSNDENDNCNSSTPQVRNENFRPLFNHLLYYLQVGFGKFFINCWR